MTFYVTTDGGYVTLVCKSGTEDEVDAKDAWLTAGGNLESLRISATSNTTGAERKLDVVIVDSETGTSCSAYLLHKLLNNSQ